jgi:hypothetical protein
MCLVTILTWIALALIVVVFGAAGANDRAVTTIGLIAVAAGILLPIAINFWQPLFFGWARRRKAVRDKLISEGVLAVDDIEKGARLVFAYEVNPGTSRKLPKSGQYAFILIDDKTCRLFGEKTCFTTEKFKIIPGCTGQCSRCWVIWACGGDNFRLQATVGEQEREFLLQSREGRTLRAAARSTEMLEEMVELACRSEETDGKENGDTAAESKDEAASAEK